MPLPLSSIAIQEKNKLASDGIWYVALKIDIPGLGTPVRVVRNNEDITWDGETWVAFPFELDDVGDVSKGEVPRLELKVSNVTRQLDQYIQTYDAYIKTNGYEPVVVTIYVINSKNLASAVPEAEAEYILKQPKSDQNWATFILGASNPFSRPFPPARFRRFNCRYRFKDYRCQYVGVETECDKTLTTCRDTYDNAEHFGGFPGIGSGGFSF